MNRREFLKRYCLTTAGMSVVGLSAPNASCSTSEPSRQQKAVGINSSGKAGQSNPVVASRSDSKVFATHGHNASRVRALVHRAVADLAGVKDMREAFRALFKPNDVVAIKVNCLAGPGMSSSVSVVDALVAGLRSVGIENKNIIIWERTSAELRKAGFETNRYSDTRPRCLGNDEAGFNREIEFSGEVGSLFTNILARRTTALINVPVLKDHDLSGVGCGMKNMYGAIHNPNRYHENNCDPYVADVSAHSYIKDKLRLVLADALTAQYQGGPARMAQHQWRPAEILAATDPVALDRVAQKLIDEQRKKHGMASLEESKRPPKWLATANKQGLGEHRLKKIRIIKS
ncbi:MAG: DUF362 domain-containing protein [Proteobacteria bacterium]|nr:DUF362 domain-containing protein [Pseudomonadota bacterium]